MSVPQSGSRLPQTGDCLVARGGGGVGGRGLGQFRVVRINQTSTMRSRGTEDRSHGFSAGRVRWQKEYTWNSLPL